MAEKVSEARLLERGMTILSVVGEASEPLTFSQILKATSLPKATLSRILSALRSFGFLGFDESGKAYILGPKLLDLLIHSQEERGERDRVMSEAQRLADELERPVWHWRLEKDQMRPVERILPFGMHSDFEARPALRLDRSAAGISVLAAMKAGKLASVLEAFANAGEPAESDVSLQLGFSAATGFAVQQIGGAGDIDDIGQYEVAAAIVDGEGLPQAALAVVCDPSDMSDTERHQIGRKLAFATQQISPGTGYGPRRKENVLRAPKLGAADARALAIEAIGGSHFDKVGSSPFWDRAMGRMVWIDSLGGAINWFEPGKRSGQIDNNSVPVERLELNDLPGAVACYPGGKAIVASRRGISVTDYKHNRRSVLSHPEPEEALRRFSTARIGPDGRLWVGTLRPAPMDRLGQGRIYALSADGRIEALLNLERGVKGLCWSPDGTKLYLTEAGSKAILCFEMDERSGRPTNPRRFALHAGDGTPNGIAMDREGCLWAAIYGGWQVVRFDPQGHVIQTIELPVPLPTGLCFFGPKNQDLFITTCRLHVPPEILVQAPQSGAPLRIACPVAGVPDPEFKVQYAK